MIKVLVEGQKKQVENFVRCFEYLKQFHICYRSYLTNNEKGTDDVRIDLFINPGYEKRKTTEVHMMTTDGKQLRIDLLDAKVVKMSDQHTVVFGKHFDIFG